MSEVAWPATICTETPAMKPTITACSMKRTRLPARRNPATSMSRPVMTVSTSMPATRCCGGSVAMAPPAARQSAAVGTMVMRSEPSVSAPAGVPTITE